MCSGRLPDAPPFAMVASRRWKWGSWTREARLSLDFGFLRRHLVTDTALVLPLSSY